jgi:hypothetical protein
MFKNRFYKAAVLVTLAVSACSCNKYLDLHPQNGITSDQFWQTKEQIQGAVTGIYSTLLSGPATDFFEWGEVRADYVAPGSGVTTDETNMINTNILPNNGLVSWGSFYNVINLCNNVIQNAPGVLNKDKTLSAEVLNGYLGEAYAIRALMYFYLVRSFGDVPLSLKYIGSDNDLTQLAKTPKMQILDQIIADLKIADTDALASFGNTASDKGRIIKTTVETIMADVYLWRSALTNSADDYANCIAECDKVISSGRYGLVPGNTGWYTALYVTGNSIEGIFELQYNTQSLDPFFSYFSTSGKPHFLAAPDLIDNYGIDDMDPNNIDIRSYDVAVHAADNSIYKYIAASPNSHSVPVHWIMYRYADVLLMKAEACIYSNRGQDALDLINQIRTRANALPASLQSPSTDDVAGLTDYLVAERGREFAFEGKRWYDLLRNAMRNNFARIDILTSAALVSVPSLYQQSALSRLRDPNALYFPIPQADINNDPNLVQNPFYQ